MDLKTLAGGGILGVVSAVSMTFLFNNAPFTKTNNQLAAMSGAITAVTFVALKTFKVV